MRNIKLLIEYDGGRYKGWQKLKDNSLTIQEKFENLLSKMTNEEISVIGCGRTDASVHALNYCANFHTNSNMSTDDMFKYINKFLPEDIKVKLVKDCSERFHARYNALNKTYLYRINNNKSHNIFNRHYEYSIIEKLDIEKMQQATDYLIGTHDFQSFTTMKSKKKSTIKTINSITILNNENHIDIEINGNSFLWHMVRIIVGTLIEVGKNNLAPEDIISILKKCKREFSGPKAPAYALFLKNVEY